MYRTLFAIDLLHSYFSDSKSRGARIVPTEDCRRAMRGYRLIFRQSGGRGYILGNLDENSEPAVAMDPSTVFRFYLVADDPSFFDFTTLPFDPKKPERLYLSNLSANSANGRSYLTVPPSAFAVAADYSPGDMAASGADLFECIQSQAANPGNSVSDADHWVSRGSVRAPGPDDLLEFGSGDKSIGLPAAEAHLTVTIFSLNRASNVFDRPVSTVSMDFSPAAKNIPIPLGKLADAGKYLASVGGAQRFFYHDPALRPGAILGVVEIFNHLAPASPHSLLDAAGKAKGTVFSVVFLNPMAVWKYIARTANVKKIRDKSGKYSFDDSVSLEFRSKTPIPIFEEAYNQIEMDYKPSGAATPTTYTKIKTPAPRNFKRMAAGADTLRTAEIYLNY